LTTLPQVLALADEQRVGLQGLAVALLDRHQQHLAATLLQARLLHAQLQDGSVSAQADARGPRCAAVTSCCWAQPAAGRRAAARSPIVGDDEPTLATLAGRRVAVQPDDGPPRDEARAVAAYRALAGRGAGLVAPRAGGAAPAGRPGTGAGRTPRGRRAGGRLCARPSRSTRPGWRRQPARRRP
jgi:hypothetical protein